MRNRVYEIIGRNKLDLALILLIVLLCVLLMLPRIFSAQFGLLDDGVLLESARVTLKNPALIWSSFKDVGRFLPSVFLLRMVFFALAGTSARHWYILMLVQLILTCLPLAFILRRSGSSRLQLGVAVITLLCTPALIESYYTLSKSEVQLVMLLAWTLFLGTSYKTTLQRVPKILVIVFTFVAMLLCVSTKETTIVLPFLFLSWILIDWIFLKKTGFYRDQSRIDLILFLCSLVSVLVYWAGRYLLGYPNVGSSGFTSGYRVFNVQIILDNLSTMVISLIRNYSYLIPAVLAWILIKPVRGTPTRAVSFKWVIWMIVWLGILLPWRYSTYYFLPFQLGAAIFNGNITGDLLQQLWLLVRKKRIHPSNRSFKPLLRPVGVWILALSSFLLLIPSTVNATASATEQLTYDLANWRLIQNVVKLPANSRLILGLSKNFEYFPEIQLMVGNILNRNDIVIDAYQYPVQVNPGQATFLAYIVYPNPILSEVRALDRNTAVAWSACLETESVAARKVFSTKVIRPVVDIGLERLIPTGEKLNLHGFSDRAFVIHFKITYGWNLMQFNPTEPYLSRPGVYKNGVFILQTISGKTRTVAFGQGNEEPFVGDLNGDGFTDLVLYDPVQNTWQVDFDLDGKADETFRLSGMQPGDLPFLGDWNGDGKDTPGFFRPGVGGWYIYSDVSSQPEFVLTYGMNTDTPIVGDWDGDGKTEFGIYRGISGIANINLKSPTGPLYLEFQGEPNATPVVGNWEATQRSGLAFVKNEAWKMIFSLGYCLQPSPVKQFTLDYVGVPFAGVWKDQ